MNVHDLFGVRPARGAGLRLVLLCTLTALLAAPASAQDPNIFGEWAEPPDGQPDNDPNDGGDYGW